MLKYLFVFVVSAWILSLDQASKLFVHTQVTMGDPIVIIKGFFNIAYVRNAGGAFGLFGDSSSLIRFILFLIFPIICVGFIFAMLRDTQKRLEIMALSFVLGGAIGNYIDRVRLGYVIDFVDWHVKSWHWPTFNFADSFIVIGVGFLLYFYNQEMRQKKVKA